MKTGFTGTFVISWAQTELDGLRAADLRTLLAGTSWLWRGDALRVDGPQGLLRLQGADVVDQLRRRIQQRIGTLPPIRHDEDDPLLRRGFIVTDGQTSYHIGVIETERDILLVFQDEIPPQGVELWVVRQSLGALPARPAQDEVICFGHDTTIATPHGSRPISALRPGDLVLTRDHGPQPLMWIGSRHVSRARLMLTPTLRPVRIAPGAFGCGPEPLRVSPSHRLLAQGSVAQELFNVNEVLVPARDLIRPGQVSVDHSLTPITYFHLLLEHHGVIWANGVEAETFHPADMSLHALSEDDQITLIDVCPWVLQDPHLYGSAARRRLNTPEAALLRFAA